VSPRGPRLRWLLLGTNLLVLATPFFAVVGLRLYDTYLVRQTERQLIAQAVVIAEAFRGSWLDETGGAAGDFRPPGRAGDPYVPLEPVLDLVWGIEPRQSEPTRRCDVQDTPERRAGARLEPLLARMQVFNLSAVRVLDPAGCVVGTTRGESGFSLADLPEVRRALSGAYAAVARERVTDDPLPPLGDVRSRGSVRVFAALPVFADGRVIAVVRVSRTSLDALTSLWHSRRGLLLVAAATLLLGVLASAFFAALLARPLRALTRAAEAVARGEDVPVRAPGGFAPREVQVLGQALEVMTRRLRERGDYIARFAANVSHEVKTPLTAIRGAAELLRESWADMPEATRIRFLDNVEADVARMERLATRLLQLARIEAASEPDEPVDVRAFFGELAQRHGASLEVVLEDPPPFVSMPPDHLASAVGNLVDNALRHGAGKAVRVTACSRDGRLVVTVADGGPGISPANQARLFTRFFTTERDRGGTGLGLSIVKAIAERRGGRVSCASVPGETAFTLVV
jgi:signal transduction histidine kinase